MARRKRQGARWVKWTPAMADLFRLAGAASAWTAPQAVRLTPGQARMTLSAHFQSDDGRSMTAKIRLRRDQLGEWDVISEELSIPLGRITGEAAS